MIVLDADIAYMRLAINDNPGNKCCFFSKIIIYQNQLDFHHHNHCHLFPKLNIHQFLYILTYNGYFDATKLRK